MFRSYNYDYNEERLIQANPLTPRFTQFVQDRHTN